MCSVDGCENYVYRDGACYVRSMGRSGDVGTRGRAITNPSEEVFASGMGQRLLVNFAVMKFPINMAQSAKRIPAVMTDAPT